MAHYIDEYATDGVTTIGFWDGLPDVPCTQAATALAFLKERGCVTIRQRHPASNCVFEDALLQHHAIDA